MGSIIDLQPFLAHRQKPKEPSDNVWSCGKCGTTSWTLERCGLVRCSGCGARASNIFVTDIDADDRSQR